MAPAPPGSPPPNSPRADSSQPGFPDFVEPMLARSADAPFDREGTRFEVKWDGLRALVFRPPGSDRVAIKGRRGRDLLAPFPELQVLDRLPHGSVLDGEVVVFEDGKPSLSGALKRHSVRSQHTATRLSRELPALYVAFDALYSVGNSIMHEPLAIRRQHLEPWIHAVNSTFCIDSVGVEGTGSTFFDSVTTDQGLEGIVAKRLDAPYSPGKRTDAWLKIKPAREAVCLVLGWTQNPDDGFRSLVIASDFGDGLEPVGRVGSGIKPRDIEAITQRLQAQERNAPLVACDERARWVEPGIYCLVRYLERTPSGSLRAPVFDRFLANG